MFLYPFHSLGVFFLVVDAFLDATENLGHINLLGTQAKIFLQEIGVDNTAGNTHRHIADREVRLASHGCHSLGSLGPAQNLFSHIGRDAVVFEVLHIMTIDAECGQALLCMGGQHGSEIHGTGTFCTIESPHCFGIVRVHVHGLRAIAPA